MTGGALLHSLYWLGAVVYLQKFPIAPSPDANTFVHIISHPFWTFLGFSLSGTLIYYMHLYSKNYVSEISIMRGDASFDICGHNLFGGKTAPTRLPLKALRADPVDGDYLPIIANANRLRFLVDLKNGKFEDKDAFMALLTGQKDSAIADGYLRLPFNDTSAHFKKKRHS